MATWTVTPNTGVVNNNNGTFTFSRNDTQDIKTYTVSATEGGLSGTATVRVHPKAQTPPPSTGTTEENWRKDCDAMTISPSTLTFDGLITSSNQTKYVDISAAYASRAGISYSSEWINATISGSRITVTALDTNQSSLERTSFISVTLDDQTCKSITVKQLGYTPSCDCTSMNFIVENISDGSTIANKGNVSTGLAAKSIVRISHAKGCYPNIVVPSWISYSNVVYGDTSTRTYYEFTVAKNTGYDSRTGIINIYPKGASSSCVYLTVVQQGESSWCSPSAFGLAASYSKTFVWNGVGQTQAYSLAETPCRLDTISFSYAYTSPDTGWFSCTVSESARQIVLKLNSNNCSTSARSGMVYVYVNGERSSVINVSQNACPVVGCAAGCGNNAVSISFPVVTDPRYQMKVTDKVNTIMCDTGVSASFSALSNGTYKMTLTNSTGLGVGWKFEEGKATLKNL